jgi:interferon-induced transmembrane protein
MSGPTNPPPDDDWGDSGGDDWRQPQQPPPAQQPPGGYAPPPQPPPQYGAPPPQAPQPPGGAPPQTIPNYLVHSIVATLCCLPTGIVGIVYASQVSSKQAMGDFAGAKKASDNARLWSIISLVAGAVFWILYFIIFAIAGTPTYY